MWDVDPDIALIFILEKEINERRAAEITRIYKSQNKILGDIIGTALGIVDESSEEVSADEKQLRMKYREYYAGTIKELAVRYVTEKGITQKKELLADYRKAVFNTLRSRYGSMFGDEMETLYYKVLDYSGIQRC